MKIYNVTANTINSNNVNRNIFQNRLKSNKSTPAFGDSHSNNYSDTGCAVSGVTALALLASSVITPVAVYKTLQDTDNEQATLNIAKGDSLISDYKNRLENEKEILTRKTYPTDKFMETLRSIGNGEGGITYQVGESYEYSDKVPMFIDEIRNFEQKIYKNLSPEKKEHLDLIRRNFQINGRGIADDSDVSQDFSNSVKTDSLAVADSLLLLTQFGETIENEASQKLYNELIFSIANQYVNKDFNAKTLDKNIEVLQNIRDNIANNMTVEEQQAYEEKYDKKLEEFQQQVKEQVKELNEEHSSLSQTLIKLTLSICSAFAVLILGIPVWLIVTDAFDPSSI